MLHVEDGELGPGERGDPPDAGRAELEHHRADRNAACRQRTLDSVLAHVQPRSSRIRRSFSWKRGESSTVLLTTKFGARPSATASIPLTALWPVIRAQSSVQPMACGVTMILSSCRIGSVASTGSCS